MNTNDPIEDLFRSRSNETVGEKPRDLVWKRIESGLQNEEKKKKPIREFVSSVWFSAAVFALIAIPYFVLFIENLNSIQNKNVDFVKIDSPITEENFSKSDVLDIIESKDKSLDNSTQIVKNDKLKEQPVYKVIEGEATNSDNIMPVLPDVSSQSPIAASTIKSTEERSKTLDSIEKENQFAFSMNKKIVARKDSTFTYQNSPTVIRGQMQLKDTSEQMKMTVVPTNRSYSNDILQSETVTEVSPKKVEVNKSEILYKPFLLTIKSDILRTNFKLLKKSNHKISFKNKRIVVSFEKVNSTVILTTNEPNIDPILLGILEKNKKEIFNYYQ